MSPDFNRTLTIKEDNLDFGFRYNTVESARAGLIQPRDAQWQFLARKVVLAIYRSIC